MDPFLRQQAVSSQPVESAVAVTVGGGAIVPPNGDANKATRAILVGGAGNLTVTMADGSSVALTIPATACGVLIPIAIKATTAGTASNVVAFY